MTSIDCQNTCGHPLETTLSILKPDAVARCITGAINKTIEENGFRIIAQKLKHVRKEEWKTFYKIHEDRPFYDELCEIMAGGPVILQVLEKAHAVESYRHLMGHTDPLKAEGGTLRKEFGKSISENTVHGSDSKENALIEIDFFFKKDEMCS